ncbi:MarR family transcriptional regulator [Alkalihalobacillus oceani]|uniref:MarR family winged helix-turn-helix transcriptional regulator n=1 Tax=Halalkalibacter oceani TaxID=1653776 RepID=UPI0020422377|nr:MarR family transcriptional regulator [Halalkalibacter oceani]MCM3761747.1 MarR family transcriptional regulator [Halalkalibacter oceani]
MENKRELFQTMTRRFGFLDKNCCSIGDVDLSLAQSHILYEIDKQHEPSMQQIAETLAMDITTFSRQIQTLMKRNLVQKTPAEQDKRVAILSLTPKGTSMVKMIDERMNAYLEEVFSDMNEFEKEIVLRSIKRLNDAMAKATVCCQPLM